MLRNVRVLLLHTNHVSRIDNIGSLVSLEILNLSSNKIDMLPDARVFACLPRLKVRAAAPQTATAFLF
jgi:Leucine-rich repeat (LRR) protein